MAMSKNGLTIVALLVTLYILETGNIIEFSSPALPVHYEEEHFLSHSREKRNVLTGQWNYIIDVVVNASNVETFEQIRSSLNTTSLPIQLDNNTEISDISVTTVCSSTGTGFQCRCVEKFAWPYSTCATYGACDYMSSGICKCINAIPADGQSCQPISALLAQVEYTVDVELNVTDVETVDYLRSLLNNGSFSLALGPTVNVTDINITTVCYPNGTNFQCRCDDQYTWSYRNCVTYGACDEFSDNTCGCINSIPSNGQYCQLKEVPVVYEYQLFIEVNTTDADQLRNTLTSLTFPVQIGSHINILDADITTVCSQDGVGFQCRCENDYLWPCDKCATYGKCDGDTNSTCRCIKAVPTDGEYCQSVQRHSECHAPPVVYEYIISVELNISDVTVIDQLRSILGNISFPVSINNHIQISDVNISTVCYLSSGGLQCRCEDQHRWSCDQCLTYGSCDNITDNTCGCINAIPPDGRYCQSAHQHNFTSCPVTTISPSTTNTTSTGTTDINTTTPAVVTNSTPAATTDLNNTTAATTAAPTTPPVVYEYIISVELNISDVTVIDQLRSILGNISFPVSINNHIQISDVNISTVCYLSSGGLQCRCEDQYRWSCDQCLTYGSCDNITDNTCGCINAIPPDGRYCQSAHQHNFTSCPVTTISPSTTNTTSTGTTDINTTTPAVVTNSTPAATTDLNNTTAATTAAPTTPPVVYEYIISVELNISDVTVIDQLRSILGNISFPVSINNHIQISDVNISTVCYLSSGGLQCRCEDQYRWSCDQCLTYGSCDNITDNTCGCINAIPPDGRYCQSAHQHNFTSCPVTTISPSTTNTTSTGTTDINTTTPAVVTNSTPAATTDLNNTTAATTAAPTSKSTSATTAAPTSKSTSATTAAPTNSTPAATTDLNNTTATTTAAPTSKSTSATTAAPTISTTAATTTTTVATTSVTGQPTTASSTTSEVLSTPAPTTALTTSTSTKAPTTITTTTTTTTTDTLSTLLTSTAVTGFDVEMSVTLDKEFTAELNDVTSSAYRELESRINLVVKEQYKGLTGFIRVFVRAFREGSIIADFVVQTTQVNQDEIANANGNLPLAMQTIAPVIGSVTALYTSPTVNFPDLIFTGTPMTLTCGPPPEKINMTQISGSEWKFKEREIKDSSRFKITNSNMKSTLRVNNVILADVGLYECILRGRAVNFLQNILVRGNKIKPAPIVRLQSKVNIECKEGQIQPLECCVQAPYKVQWFEDRAVLPSTLRNDSETYCITHDYLLGSCSASQQNKFFTCKVDEPEGYERTTEMVIFKEDVTCRDAEYGTGRVGDTSSIGCDKGQEGTKSAVCLESGEWKLIMDTCIVIQIKELLIASQDLVEENVPQFSANLSTTVMEDKTEITNSSATISAIVEILNTIANVSTDITEPVMQNVLNTVDVIIGDDARDSWAILNANETRNASSELLGSLEALSDGLVGEFTITTQRILLNRTTFDNSFRADLNFSIIIDIPNTNSSNVFITTITFSSLNNVMPARNSSFDASLFNATANETVTDNAINAAVVLVQLNATIQNVTLSFDKLNNALSLNPQCVFWNFTLLDNLGAWDDEGCRFLYEINNTVTCSCNHLTSFSILMATDIPPELKVVLDVITYVGVGISMASLVICIIIEGYVWKAITRNSTAFMRHLSIINTALSLLIADICFIIAASIAKNPLENPGENHEVLVGPCSTATFFMHFFYLALFFWMLVSGLLLFYRTVMVFSHMSKSTMLAIGFSLGYGCPLIIAVITVAVTAPGNGYIRKNNACWLNWIETKALLALVIPALTIVLINILIVIVVLFKMLRRGVGDTVQADERHTLVVITRCVIILTPLFGLTWSLGVGTMISSTNKGIHIAFAFFNSLQGFFILVFGTLFDSKIRSILSRRIPTSTSTGSNPTRSTSGGISSLSGLNWISRLRGRRYIYRVSEAANSSSTGASESFISI
ncbi:adhesion G protein-coupled receptor F5-like [Pempheris klunzingeri]|uniref:adhesion G protein-coupled receptor F5-like n=1 Tax=Pempheris klunzingeri TaxID=3127111 RepID=UPI00397F805A